MGKVTHIVQGAAHLDIDALRAVEIGEGAVQDVILPELEAI